MPDGKSPEVRVSLPNIKQLKDVVHPILQEGEIRSVLRGIPVHEPSERTTIQQPSALVRMESNASSEPLKKTFLSEPSIPIYPDIGESMPNAETVIQSLDAARAAGVRLPEGLNEAAREADKREVRTDNTERLIGMLDGNGVSLPPEIDRNGVPLPPEDEVRGTPESEPSNELRGLRKTLKEMTPEEFEGAPVQEVVFEDICEWYRLPEERRFTRPEMEKYNKNLQYFITYTVRAKEDQSFVRFEMDLLRKGVPILARSTDPDIRRMAGDLDNEGFEEKLAIIKRALAVEVAADPNLRPFSKLEDDRTRIAAEIRQVNPEVIEQLQQNKSITTRKEELEFLKSKLAGVQYADIRGRLDLLIGEYESHPVMTELGEVIQAREAEIQKRLSGDREQIKTEPPKELMAPDKSFEQALIDSTDETKNEQEREEGHRAIGLYYQIADRIGLLDHENDNATVDFFELRKKIEERVPDKNGDPATKQRKLLEYKAKVKDEEAVRKDKAEGDWKELGEIYVSQSHLKDEYKVGNLSVDKLNGFLDYYRKGVQQEIVDYLTPGKRLEDKNRDAEWGAKKVLEDEDALRRRAEGGLWRVGYSGMYEIMIRDNDPAKFQKAAESFVTNLITSGVIDREPQALMQKAQYFSEALISKAIELADTKYLEDQPEKAEFLQSVKDIRMAFNVEIYAYCGELFNHTFNIQNLSAIYSRMNNMIDGMDHWKVAMQLRDGQVYGAYLSQSDPEFEWMWRMMGPNGQLSGNFDAQHRVHSMMKDRLANKRVGEVIWDRFEKVVDGKRTGEWIVGDKARKKNLDILGYDISKEDTERAFVPKTSELLRMIGITKGQLTEELLDLENDSGVFTLAEKQALRLRDIKARMAKKQGIKNFNKEDILGIYDENEISGTNKALYEKAFGNAKEAVAIYMQLISMTGDKARETSAMFVANARNNAGELVQDVDQATELDKIPEWRAERLLQFAKNIAQRKIADHNKRLGAGAYQLYLRKKREADALRRKHKPEEADAKEKESPYIARGGVRFKEIMGDTTNKQLIVGNSVDGDPSAHHGGRDDHGEHSEEKALGPWGGDVTHFKKEVGSVVWLTMDALFKQGWSLKLKDFEIDNHGNFRFSQTSEMQVPGGVNRRGSVTLHSIAEHPLAMHMTKTYLSTQPEQSDHIVSRKTRRLAERYLNNEITAEQAGVLAMQLIAIDPALNRLVEIPNDRVEQSRYVMAAIEESALNHNDIKRSLGRQFRGFVQWEYNSMMSTGLRRLQSMSAFAATQDKLSPRAEWMVPYISSYVEPLGDSFGLKHSFEAIKLIKRRNISEAQAKQEILDPPELDAVAQLFNIGMKIYGAWFGAEGKPGIVEKPTAASENVTGDELEANEVRLMSDEELADAGLPPGTHAEISKSISHQLQLQKKTLEMLSREQPLFDQLFAEMSQNFGANGASDLRQIEIFDYDENGNIVYKDGVPKFNWRLDRIDANGVRSGEDIGRARHETAVVARAFTTYLKSFQMRDEKGRISSNGKPYIFNGGASEYSDAAYWERHLNVYLAVHDLPQADREGLPAHLQKKRYVTLEDFIISKWSRR